MRKQIFVLEVNSAQNQSWQGTLKWIDGHKQESFRSMLEMLHLIDSAVDGGEGGAPAFPETKQ